MLLAKFFRGVLVEAREDHRYYNKEAKQSIIADMGGLLYEND